MSIFSTLWNRLRGSKRYREEFVATYARRAVPYQVRAIMRKRGITQPQLAESSSLTQGVISRATNPAYGKLTLNTIIRLVVGLDMGLIIRVVPVSKMVREYNALNEQELSDVATFDEENEQLEREQMALGSLRDTKAMGETPEELASDLARMQEALRKPVMIDDGETLREIQ